ncbi:MAG: myo-inosose-2 dehydratase [Alicyclobacillus sp.]|nr:myo-inosose-2 dehydratase [Alicyclobacillus sp.]
MYNVRLAASPINWINDDMTDLGDFYDVETVLSNMRDLGFAGTEMGRKYPRDPSQLRKLLNRYGLVLSGAWKTVQFSSGWNSDQDFADFQVHVQFLQRMGARYAVVCDGGGSLHWDPRGPRWRVEKFDDAAWARLAAGLNRAGAYSRRFGVEVVYHAHLGTGVETPAEIDRLMAMTDPDVVSLLGDTGHIFAGGGVPEQVFEKHLRRIHYIHLKDVRRAVLDDVRAKGTLFTDAVRQGLFTTPGDGCIDFPAVFDVLQRGGYQGWMVMEAEQDPTKAEPVAYARAAKAYLEALMDDAKV